MSETLNANAHNAQAYEQLEQQAVPAPLTQHQLEAFGTVINSFYGGADHFIGRTPDGEFRSIVIQNQDGRSTNETAGTGEDTISALYNALEGMRSLETVQTRPIIRIRMKEDVSVDFTELVHYSPQIAPTTEPYSIPDHLKDALADSTYGMKTYKETVAQEGWEIQLTDIVSGYLVGNEYGQQLKKQLKIADLQSLTPEQAVKLSLSLVQNISKYSRDEQGNPDGKFADGMPATQLLKEGIDNKSDKSWRGSGVCRNIASNTKAVFEALKATQGEYSMLKNTYAVFEAGYDGEGYDDKREDTDEGFLNTKLAPKSEPGHAWLKFVTVDSKGSANIAIVDPTWALEKDASTALQHMDYTLPRMAKLAGDFFASSEHKKENIAHLSYYYDRLVQKSLTDGEGPLKREKLRKFALAEYVKAAELALPEFEDGEYFPDAPSCVTAAAYQLKDKLQDNELYALYKVSKFGSVANFNEIAKAFATGNTVPRPGWKRIEMTIKADDGLQAEIFSALGEQKLQEYARDNGMFRAKVRRLMPDALPAFDALTNKADALELRYLASKANINERTSDPARIVREAQRRLRLEAGDDSLVKKITSGISDYDLLKNYDVIIAQIREFANK
jgi:hypothetical protein